MGKNAMWSRPPLYRLVRCVLPLLMLVLVACRSQDEKVEVRRADAQRAAMASMSHVENQASPFGYQVKTHGLSESGPVSNVIDVVPSYRLDAFGGQLMGDDRGEFGGELMFRDQQGSTHLLMERNVHGIFQMPFGVIVFTGLAHMRSNVGGTYLIAASPGSVPVAKPYRSLPGAPDEVLRTLDGELVFKVFNGRFERIESGAMAEEKDCYLMKNSGEVKELSCASITIVD